jgi:hypothetical protein
VEQCRRQVLVDATLETNKFPLPTVPLRPGWCSARSHDLPDIADQHDVLSQGDLAAPDGTMKEDIG